MGHIRAHSLAHCRNLCWVFASAAEFRVVEDSEGAAQRRHDEAQQRQHISQCPAVAELEVREQRVATDRSANIKPPWIEDECRTLLELICDKPLPDEPAASEKTTRHRDAENRGNDSPGVEEDGSVPDLNQTALAPSHEHASGG